MRCRLVGVRLAVWLLACLAGCQRTDVQTEKDLATPVVPQGFNVKTLEAMKCPENGSKLRFASKKELNDINGRIGALTLKTWGNGQQQTELVSAVLIRADGKIGYRVDGIVPIMKIEEALVLDHRVGPPNPAKNFR